MSTPLALLLDFGGTLDVPRHWLDRFVDQYRALGFELDRAGLDPAFSHATALGYSSTSEIKGYALPQIVEFLVRHQLDWLAEFGAADFPRSRLASDTARHHLTRAISAGFVEESRATVADTRELLAALHERHRLAVVSNFYGNLPVILAECGFAPFIDVVVDSSAAGIFKPDAGIFMIALRELGVGPRDSAMVGDSLDKDLAPARRLGLRTVWLRTAPPDDRASDEPELAEIPVDYVIHSIAELRELAW
ncbi:MAG TPA: HAD family hydrolase [Candidatus Binataceae bacterium]|nr:HAD family hydrolase [Candidatus Binataceae bacterium]